MTRRELIGGGIAVAALATGARAANEGKVIALARGVSGVVGDPDNADNLLVTLDIVVGGSDVGATLAASAEFVLAPGDNSAQMRSKATTGVVAAVEALGFTVERSNVILCEFTRGV